MKKKYVEYINIYIYIFCQHFFFGATVLCCSDLPLHKTKQKTGKKFLAHLGTFLQIIQQASFIVKAEKCQIGLDKVTYLGHKVGQGLVYPLQAKMEAIHKWPVTETKKQVQSFLGLAKYLLSPLCTIF